MSKSLMHTLLADAARHPDSPRWHNLDHFNQQMGARPEKAALLKRNTRAAHGPGNSYWSTNPDKTQDKATRRRQKEKQMPDQHPKTRKALKAFLVPRKFPPTPNSDKQDNAQVALLLATLQNHESPP